MNTNKQVMKMNNDIIMSGKNELKKRRKKNSTQHDFTNYLINLLGNYKLWLSLTF